MKLRPAAAGVKGEVVTLPNGMLQHADGVWCNLAFDDYLLDTALGSTDLKDILASEVEWWWHSRWNPLRPEEPKKEAFARGVAAHTFFLEGPTVYNRTYGVRPDRHSHPNALSTKADLLAAARGAGLGLPHTMLVPDIVSRMVKEKVPEEILQVLQAKFDRTGRLPVSSSDDAVIRILHRLAMRTRKELEQVIQLPKDEPIPREMLTGGVHEISVFWTDENGIRQCCRFDKLKPNVTGDLKTITDWRKGNFDKDLLEEAKTRGYFLQWAHYDEGRRQLRIAIAEGRLYGATPLQLKRLLEIAKPDHWFWSWLFIKADGAPRVRGVVPDREEGHYVRACQDREEALAKFLFYRERFGMEATWLDTVVVWIPKHTDYPEYYQPR